MNSKIPIIYNYSQDVLFKQFCGGESLNSLHNLCLQLKTKNISPLLNYGVEYSRDSNSLDDTYNEMKNMIDYLKKNESGQAILRVTGIMSDERLSMKQRNMDLSTIQEEEWKKDLKRLENICEYASKQNILLIFDAETMDIQTKIHELSIEMMKKYNKEKANIYGTIQFYRKDSHDQLKELLELGKCNDFKVGLKLVRGAYIFDEIKNNRRHLIHDNKENTNKSYNDAVSLVLENIDNVYSLFATHNLETVNHILSILEKENIPYYSDKVIIAQMLGMRKDITFNLHNVNVSQFIPYGKKSVLFPYLVRRGIENSSSLGNSKIELLNAQNEILRRLS